MTLPPVAVETEVFSWGEWIGHYSGHFDQVIRIEQRGQILEATKVTGDDFVNAGEVTWKVHLPTMDAVGRVSEEEGRNMAWVPGKLVVLGKDRLRFYWSAFGVVDYRLDDELTITCSQDTVTHAD